MRVEADGKHEYFRFVRLFVTVTRFPVAEFVNPLDFLEDISLDALVSHAAWSRRLRLQAVRLACPQRNLCATVPMSPAPRCHYVQMSPPLRVTTTTPVVKSGRSDPGLMPAFACSGTRELATRPYVSFPLGH